MSAPAIFKFVRDISPGETRIAALDQDGRACRLFLERWQGHGEPARSGSTHQARVRTFADNIGGAFLELASGEEAFLRLKTRDGFTEGQQVTVTVASAGRPDKLARVTVANQYVKEQTGLELWLTRLTGTTEAAIEDDAERVDAAFDEALSNSVVLPNGGRLHIERTRALTAFDVDTAGRVGKGSAGARALAINRDAARTLARQISLRGLGGNVVLDCVSPLNKRASDDIRETTQKAFEALGVQGVNVLRPSALGLLELSIPWRDCPLEDRLATHPSETELLELMRRVLRDAQANPTELYVLELSNRVWRAYLGRQEHADPALRKHLGGRVSVRKSDSDESGIEKR